MKLTFTTNQSAFSAANRRKRRQISRGVNMANQETAVDLLFSMAKHASGRPGPDIVTGEFIGNMWAGVEHDMVVGGNNSPQAMRLEYGFVGEDSMGRHYFQPPYPWLGPAVEEVWPRYQERIRKVMEEDVS